MKKTPQLTDYDVICNLLKRFGIFTKKRLGQHFLIDEKVLSKIMETAEIEQGEFVTEIGAGHGVLTLELLKNGALVDAIEIDQEILPLLKYVTKDHQSNLTIHSQHVFDFEQKKSPFKLIANIPYYLSSPIIRKFLVEADILPKKIVLLIQKEVAERICKDRGSILSLFVRVFGEPRIVEIVSEKSFFPPPKVKSAILCIDIFKQPKTLIDKNIFFSMVKNGFSSPRKMLKNVLAGIFSKENSEIEEVFNKLKIPLQARAEDLSIQDWESLTKHFFVKKLVDTKK